MVSLWMWPAPEKQVPWASVTGPVNERDVCLMGSENPFFPWNSLASDNGQPLNTASSKPLAGDCCEMKQVYIFIYFSNWLTAKCLFAVHCNQYITKERFALYNVAFQVK